jgi:hypothetical protein
VPDKDGGLRAGEWTGEGFVGPLTGEQMKALRAGEDVEPTLGPKTDEDDLQRRVTIALADWKTGVYCACMAKGLDPRHVDLPCEHADKHRVGLVDSAIRAAEHEAAQGPGEVVD